MKRTLKALSALLSYPSAELQGATAEIRAAILEERVLPPGSLAGLDTLLASLAAGDLLDLQAAYSERFDGSRALSLHLFEHVHGESRERGAALVDLAQAYHQHGFAIDGHELPDYLPLFLEFLSFLPAAEAKTWLAQPAHVLAAIGERLRESGSAYAAVFGALRALGGEADPQAVAEVRTRMRDEEAEGVDARWEEAPVTFTAPQPAARATGGIIARIHARLGR